ncbi:MAG: iron-sulfur protein [Acidimicrobiales bacterium]|nr:iron-sulfur protein [Acidimicrobiales bacterium]
MKPADLVSRIGSNAALDKFAKPLKSKITDLIPGGAVKDALSGTWLGHQLHPMLTDVVIGSFTSATILDLIGGRRAARSANVLAITGVLAVAPTAASGLSDWSDTNGSETRIGVVHALSNVVGASCYVASIIARRRGNRVSASMLGLVGMGVMSVGGYLGGHLTLVQGVGVNHTFLEESSQDWKAVVDADQLEDATAKVVADGDVDVVVYGSSGWQLAVSKRCTHAGGPLDEGTFEGSGPNVCVVCPWHGSTFRMRDGSVVHGPATVPQPAYDVRVHEGKVEIRSI